jgi:hypothetical protein
MVKKKKEKKIERKYENQHIYEQSLQLIQRDVIFWRSLNC